MSTALQITVNGQQHAVIAEPSTPLLYILRNEVGAMGPRFGCGLAQCGACTVHVDGRATRSCVTPVSAAANAPITTLDGLSQSYVSRNGAPKETLHPVQQAFIDEQAMQCGYCINGWIMTAAALLESNPNATDAQIRAGLSRLKCRCGSHMSILRAVKLAASRMRGKVAHLREGAEAVALNTNDQQTRSL